MGGGRHPRGRDRRRENREEIGNSLDEVSRALGAVVAIVDEIERLARWIATSAAFVIERSRARFEGRIAAQRRRE
jgi:hypothetical protein